MRHGRMRAASFDLDLENIEGGHHRAWLDSELPDRQSGPVVHSENSFDRILP